MAEVPVLWKCAAGRTAFLGGKWRRPCVLPTEHQHTIISVAKRIDLCDTHFAEANAEGHVDYPYISEEVAEHMAELERAELERRRPKGKL